MLLLLHGTQKKLSVNIYMCGSLLKEAGAIMILKDLDSEVHLSSFLFTSACNTLCMFHDNRNFQGQRKEL